MRRIACGFMLLLGASVNMSAAQDFCVQNKVYFGKDSVESTTVFSAGTVYDFLSMPQEITMFDAPRNRFVVLDPTRKIKIEIDTEQVNAFTQKLKGAALDRPVPLMLFLANPKFEETYDDASGELVFSSEWMKYKVKTVAAKQPDMAERYYTYSDWQVKLNTLIKPGSPPPFARLLLNASLAKQGRLPSEVELTRFAQHPRNRHITLRAEHHFFPGIGRKEQTQIEEANRGLVLFSSVPLKEYYQRPEASDAKAAESAAKSRPDAKKS